ncbi:bifunctional phosphoglucose/phosphomannose isomerase [Candidatus Margulisiibacteriota bacterium]
MGKYKTNKEFVSEVCSFPQMLEAARFLGEGLGKLKKPRVLFIAGMGGSAVSGDLLAEYLKDQVDLPIYIIRSYSLPAFAKRGDLLIAVSYSGNTEETLSVLRAAEKKRLKIASITSGGKLKARAETKSYPLILLPQGFQPRSALPNILVAIIKVLERATIIKSKAKELEAAVKLICSLEKKWGYHIKKLARELKSKIPIIFSSNGTTAAIGYRYKTQFNENAKVTAHLAQFPELNHNEIVNLSYLKKGKHPFIALLLVAGNEHSRIKKRIKITCKLLSRNLGKIRKIEARGNSPLERMLSLIYFGDLLTLYLALEKRVDPQDVAVIEKLKEALRK